MSVTFAVTDVKDEKGHWGARTEKMDGQKLLQELVKGKKLEAYGGPKEVVYGVNCNNGFFQAIHHAFDNHLPLVLSPDHVWLTIERGFAEYVSLNAEKLRSQLVGFEGKKELIVRRDGFRKGDPSNDWQGCFTEFSEQIKGHAPTLQKITVANFSTTGAIEKAASEVLLMDAAAKYFEYTMRTCCGIPTITLLGISKDWEDIYNRVQVFREYGLAWWADALSPVLDGFVSASRGMVDVSFWEDLYKRHSISGGDSLSGHVLAFMPNFEKNQMRYEDTKKYFGGPSSDNIPTAISKVRPRI